MCFSVFLALPSVGGWGEETDDTLDYIEGEYEFWNWTLQARLSEVDGENARFKSLLKQKDGEMEDIDKVTKRLQEERGKVADIIRQEFADRLVPALYLQVKKWPLLQVVGQWK